MTENPDSIFHRVLFKNGIFSFFQLYIVCYGSHVDCNLYTVCRYELSKQWCLLLLRYMYKITVQTLTLFRCRGFSMSLLPTFIISLAHLRITGNIIRMNKKCCYQQHLCSNFYRIIWLPIQKNTYIRNKEISLFNQYYKCFNRFNKLLFFFSVIFVFWFFRFLLS